MQILPAIDLKDGKCVRLIQGDYSKKTEYNDNPIEQAEKWKKFGAELIHLVDLDGAKDGIGKNYPVIQNIIKKVDIPVEVGGGIRTIETIEKLLAIGVSQIIIGTAAVKDKVFLAEALKKFRNNITVGIDAKDNFVAIDGWIKSTSIDFIEFAIQLEKLGCRRIIYTDISRDGMLTSPNFENTKKLADAVSKIKIIASGGVSKLKDIEDLINLNTKNITGVIIGKALYENKFNLNDAISLTKK